MTLALTATLILALSVGRDKREGEDGHPLHHAVMTCIEAVAAQQAAAGAALREKQDALEGLTRVGEGEDVEDVEDVEGVSYLCKGLDLYATRRLYIYVS